LTVPLPHAERPRPSRRTLALIVVPLISLVIAAWIGDAMAAQWFDRHPLALIALNARNRNLVLTTEFLDPWSFYVVGGLRLLASDPLFYLLGYFYGDAAVRWMEHRSRTFGGMMRSAERVFGKAAYPLVVIAPNNFICLFAGSAGMRPAVFIVLNVSGTIGRLLLIRWVGIEFAEPLDAVRDFIADYRLPLTVLLVVTVAITIWRETRPEGELESLVHLEEEIEEAAEELEAEEAEAEASGPERSEDP
jgi:membrane protein DedA with SNARE-associated domain